MTSPNHNASIGATLIIATISALFIAGCSNGRNAKLPSINDYSGPNAKQHGDNVSRYFRRPNGYEWKTATPKTSN